MNPPLILERVTRVAPLGVRFWDDVTGGLIRDDLQVIAYPANHPELPTNAILTLSGVYAFIHLPGLRDFENGRGDADFWASAPPGRPFVIQVSDDQSRFQSFQFTVEVPTRGIYTLDCASPLASPPESGQAGVPLFSSPARIAPGAMAALRADLWDVNANAPAAYALLEAKLDGPRLARGFADQQGRVALIFAYPEPPGFSLGSPMTGRRALSDQSWTIQLRAFYSPVTPVPALPDLCTVLNQRETRLFASLSPTAPLIEATLAFGQELVLKTQSQSELLIAPA